MWLSESELVDLTGYKKAGPRTESPVNQSLVNLTDGERMNPEQMTKLEAMALQGMSAHAIIRAVWNAAIEEAAAKCEEYGRGDTFECDGEWFTHEDEENSFHCARAIRALQVPE